MTNALAVEGRGAFAKNGYTVTALATDGSFALSYLPTKNWIVTSNIDHDRVRSDDVVRRLKRNRVSVGATFSF